MLYRNFNAEIQLSSEVIQLGNWFTYNDIENIKKMYKDGKSFEEIAKVIGCTVIAIETTLRAERIIS